MSVIPKGGNAARENEEHRKWEYIYIYCRIL
jgi:hypothetical protein